MHVIFFGTPAEAVPVAAAVAKSHHALIAVVCQPDKPAGRGKKNVAPPIKVWADEHGIPVHQPAKLNDGTFEDWLKDHAPDCCAVAAYGRILKAPILAVPSHGYLNVHPSLLPKYRGPSPIQTTLLNGDKVTGVTIMAMDEGMDTGPILLQEELPVDAQDNACTLSEKLFGRGAEMLIKGLDLVEAEHAHFTPQDEALASYTRMFEKDDGRIDWSQPAQDIHNRIRACNPWPIAFTQLTGESLRIHEAAVCHESYPEEPGTIVRIETDQIVVACGKEALAIRTLQAPGKRAMPADAFLRGRPLEPGVVLGN